MEESLHTETLQGVLHQPTRPTGDAIVLTHGAGSNCQAPLLAGLARAFAESGYLVLRYDLPFRRDRRSGPPTPASAAHDRQGILHAVEAMRPLATGRIFAGGHSYGGRQTAMLAAERPDLAAGLLLLSYPLHPPRKPDQKRTVFFPDLRIPALFVHGTRDPFGSPEELREAASLIPGATGFLIVDGAGHDLKRAAGMAPEILRLLRALC